VSAAAPSLPLLVSVSWNVEVHGPRMPGVVVVDDERVRWGGHGHGHGRW
jgi:hypothetical protein